MPHYTITGKNPNEETKKILVNNGANVFTQSASGEYILWDSYRVPIEELESLFETAMKQFEVVRMFRGYERGNLIRESVNGKITVR